MNKTTKEPDECDIEELAQLYRLARVRPAHIRHAVLKKEHWQGNALVYLNGLLRTWAFPAWSSRGYKVPG